MLSDAGDDMITCTQTNEEALRNHMDRNVDSAPPISSNVSEEEFMDARFLIDGEESEHGLTEEERLITRENSCRFKESSNIREILDGQSLVRLDCRFSELGDLGRKNNGEVEGKSEGSDKITLQANLDRITKDLKEVRLLNSQFQDERELQLSCQQEAELVREQVEMETARTILQLQEEVASLQCTLDEKLGSMAQENEKLRKIVATKDEELKALNMEWERATLELTGFLVDGSRSLRSISRQIESIACSFPETSLSISEHVERAAKAYIEKEETILHLKTNLEDAQGMVQDLGQKLSSLKGVTLALTEFQNLNDEEISQRQVSTLSDEKSDRVQMIEKKLKLMEGQVIEAEKCASIASIMLNWLFDTKKFDHEEQEKGKIILALRHQPKNLEYITEDTLSLEAHEHQKFGEHYDMLRQMADEISKANGRLEVIEDFVCGEVDTFDCSSNNEGMLNVDEWSPACSSSSSDFSIGSVASGKSLNASSCSGGCISPENTSKQMDLKSKGSILLSHTNTSSRDLSRRQTTRNLLQVELVMLFDSFNILRSRVAVLLDGMCLLQLSLLSY